MTAPAPSPTLEHWSLRCEKANGGKAVIVLSREEAARCLATLSLPSPAPAEPPREERAESEVVSDSDNSRWASPSHVGDSSGGAVVGEPQAVACPRCAAQAEAIGRLREFAEHKSDCKAWMLLDDGTPMVVPAAAGLPEHRCTCGLDAVLASLPQEPKP